MSAVDIVLVGNGVLSLATAVALVEEQPGIRIALVGPPDRPLAASPAAGAMLGCFGEVTNSLLSSAVGKEKLALNVAASGMWSDWVTSLNEGAVDEDALTITRGTFVLLNAKSARMDDANFLAIKDALTLYARAFEVVNGRDIPSLNPLEDCRPIEALYLKDEGSIDSGHLLNRLSAKISSTKEITIVNGRVERLQVLSGSIRAVELDDGSRISSPLVILASGFESQRLIDQIPGLSRRIPRLFPGAGTAVLLQPTDPLRRIPCVVRTPNRSFACGLHAVPRRSGAVYVGATNHIRMLPFSAPIAYDVHFLLECAIEQINTDLHLATLADAIVGHRPVSIDGFPLVGPTSISGLWLLTGTYRDGLHLSPLLSKHIAREMLGKNGLVQHRFYPERRPISVLTKEEAIKEASSHHMAIAYEHSARLPGGWNEKVQELFEVKFRGFYDQIESDVVLPPEFVPMILVSKNPQEIISFFREYYSNLDH